ncbi:MAG: colanic acid biosynthesis acetyltransferase WcaF [Bacteroidetes bacterium]|nr:MAG: colanic acid biosynthesis acetyltransferase WcaF [Bacteroidota bacterium]
MNTLQDAPQTVDLSSYDNSWYHPGGGSIKRLLWYVVNVLFFTNRLNPLIGLKVWLLRLFGAQVGKGVIIKPAVNIKYPWHLHIGNHVWIGEGAWIDNLTRVELHDHVCLSQGAMLLTGNHNYKRASFDLMLQPIVLEEGVWIGAQAVVCPGVRAASHAVLAVGSVATQDLQAWHIYQGNPAVKVRKREVTGDRMQGTGDRMQGTGDRIS